MSIIRGVKGPIPWINPPNPGLDSFVTSDCILGPGVVNPRYNQ